MHGTCAIFGCKRGSEILAHGGILYGHDICDNTSAAQYLQKQTVAALKLEISAKAADKKPQQAETRAKFKKREIKFEKHKSNLRSARLN